MRIWGLRMATSRKYFQETVSTSLLRHQGEPLSAMPAPGPRKRPSRPHRCWRCHPPLPGRPSWWPPDPKRWEVDRRAACGQCHRHQHRRPDRSTQQRSLQERVAPRAHDQRWQPPLHCFVLQPLLEGHHHSGNQQRRRSSFVPQVCFRGLHGGVREAEVHGQRAQV
ncbi:unnamed protein product [Musa acuminata var. zebrina]